MVCIFISKRLSICKLLGLFTLSLGLFVPSVAQILVTPTSPYLQNFEATNGGWSTTNVPNGTWQWGQPRKANFNQASEGPQGKCWFNGTTTGCYLNSDSSLVESPAFDLRQMRNPVIRFRIYVALEANWEVVAFKMAVRSGAPWITIGDNRSTGCRAQNWYNNSDFRIGRNGTQIPVPLGWTGISQNNTICETGAVRDCPNNGSCGRWVTAKYCLKAAAGRNNVRFAFQMATSGTRVRSEGFGFDSFEVFEDNSLEDVNIRIPANICQYSRVTLTNLAPCVDSASWLITQGADTILKADATNSRNLDYEFQRSGRFRVRLFVKNPCGGIGVKDTAITVSPKPNIRILGIPDTLCPDIDTLPISVTPLGGTFRVLQGGGQVTTDSRGRTIFIPGRQPGGQSLMYFIGNLTTSCASVDTAKVLVLDEAVRPGLPVSSRGNTLCAGSANALISSSWPYKTPLQWRFDPDFAVVSRNLVNDTTIRVVLSPAYIGNIRVWNQGVGFCGLGKSDTNQFLITRPVGDLVIPQIRATSDTICDGVLTTISTINRTTGASGYQWIVLPAEASSAVRRVADTAVSIEWNNTFLGGVSVQVRAIGQCDSALSDPLNVVRFQPPVSLPLTFGDSAVCAISGRDTFYTPVNPGTTLNYTLEPASAGIVAGIGTGQAVVNWNSDFTGPVRMVINGTTICGPIAAAGGFALRVYGKSACFAGPDLECPADSSIQITAAQAQGKFRWYPSTGLSNDTILNPIVKLDADQTYVLETTNEGGCVSYDTLLVKVVRKVYIPNCFFPVGDNETNRVWRAKMPGIRASELTVFNRWGNKVYESKGAGLLAWSGEGQVEGVYYYLISATEEKSGEVFTYKGWIQMVNQR